MRTIEEIRAYIEPLDGQYFDEHDQGEQGDAGMLAGFKRAAIMIEEGKSSAEILEYTRRCEQGYTSWGDDYADAWQSGYICALYWAAEQYDWTASGLPIFREGNIFGLPVATDGGAVPGAGEGA